MYGGWFPAVVLYYLHCVSVFLYVSWETKRVEREVDVTFHVAFHLIIIYSVMLTNAIKFIFNLLLSFLETWNSSVCSRKQIYFPCNQCHSSGFSTGGLGFNPRWFHIMTRALKLWVPESESDVHCQPKAGRTYSQALQE
jgi:hypothetical protein